MSTTRTLLQSLAAISAVATVSAATAYAGYTQLQANIAQNPNVRYEHLPYGNHGGGYFRRMSPVAVQQATERQARRPQETGNQTAWPYRSCMRRP